MDISHKGWLTQVATVYLDDLDDHTGIYTCKWAVSPQLFILLTFVFTVI